VITPFPHGVKMESRIPWCSMNAVVIDVRIDYVIVAANRVPFPKWTGLKRTAP